MSIKESALSTISSLASGDFLRVVTNGGASRRISVSNAMKKINESTTISPTFPSTTVFTNSASRASRAGNVVLVKIDGTVNSAASNWTTIMTGLPAPAFTMNANIVANGGNVLRARVNTSGEVQIAGGNVGNIGTSFVYIA